MFISLVRMIRLKGCGGLMVGVLDPGSSGLGSSPGQGHCVVVPLFTLMFKCMRTGEFNTLWGLEDGGCHPAID